MKITIGIPCYNQQDYLMDAIQSALDQTIKCEVIVCNDGSSDNSLDIAKNYPVKVIDQVNKGLPSARNSLIMNATGEYIIFLDSDDILQPWATERTIQEIEKTNADIIAFSFKCFGKENHQVTINDNLTIKDFLQNNRIPYCAAIRRSSLLEVGGYSPRMIWGWEDWHLWINLLSKGKTIVSIKDMMFLYRTKDSSMYTESLKHSDKLMVQIKKDFPLLYA